MVGRAVRFSTIRSITLTLTIVAVLGALGAVLLSPMALTRLPVGQGVDWNRLSNIGQTYGAASAVLSALALGGVAISLVLQHRESKAAREQALRALHADLFRKALEEEIYLECWGPIGASTDRTWYRQHIYLNLIVSHWQLMWELGALTEPHLRLAARGIFAGPLGLRFWSEARDLRPAVEKGRRARIFHTILEQEYQEAVARRQATTEETREDNDAGTSGVPDTGGSPASRPAPGTLLRTAQVQPPDRLAWLITGASLALAVSTLIRRSRRRQHRGT
jgi:hypothetical protein